METFPYLYVTQIDCTVQIISIWRRSTSTIIHTGLVCNSVDTCAYIVLATVAYVYMYSKQM